ncbi:MAG: site-2 protease family protein, partial [Candidatus Heimdallarchaeota archaeon]
IVQRPEQGSEKMKFTALRKESIFIENNLKVLIRNEPIAPGNKQIVIRFYYWEKESAQEQFKFKKIALNIGLFLATIVTVSLAGWTYISTVFEVYNISGNIALDIFLYTICLMGILTIHEFGHYFVSRSKKIDASLPYFIPVPSFPAFQTLGTFGAVIQQKEQIATRDDLFDVGFSGPIAGFAVAIPIFIIGLKLTYVADIPVPAGDPINLVNIPTVFLSNWLEQFSFVTGIIPYYDPTTQVVVQHPVAFAGWVGFILTGINLMPASQLDGGHTARAVFGDAPHRIITIVIGLLLALNQFTRYFGFLILFMGMFQKHPGPTDDVSKVHWSKYIYLTFGYFLAIICTPLPIYQVLSLLGVPLTG